MHVWPRHLRIGCRCLSDSPTVAPTPQLPVAQCLPSVYSDLRSANSGALRSRAAEFGLVQSLKLSLRATGANSLAKYSKRASYLYLPPCLLPFASFLLFLTSITLHPFILVKSHLPVAHLHHIIYLSFNIVVDCINFVEGYCTRRIYKSLRRS